MKAENLSEVTENSEARHHDQWENISGGVCEIEEVVSSEVFDDNNDKMSGNNKLPSSSLVRLQSIKEGSSNSVRSYDDEDSIYVVISAKEEITSMDALFWAIDHCVVIRDSSVIFLIHVFPETKFIPTPLGKLPISQVNPEQKENYMAKERGKRIEYLHKFINVCDTSQVKVDTILIESDMEAKAILDLVPILGIKKLILGASKPYVRKLRNKRGNGVIDQIVQNAPEYCEVKIICEGKDMSEMINAVDSSPVSSPMHSNNNNHRSPPKYSKENEKEKESANDEDLPSCGCFKM